MSKLRYYFIAQFAARHVNDDEDENMPTGAKVPRQNDWRTSMDSSQDDVFNDVSDDASEDGAQPLPSAPPTLTITKASNTPPPKIDSPMRSKGALSQ